MMALNRCVLKSLGDIVLRSKPAENVTRKVIVFNEQKKGKIPETRKTKKLNLH